MPQRQSQIFPMLCLPSYSHINPWANRYNMTNQLSTTEDAKQKPNLIKTSSGSVAGGCAFSPSEWGQSWLLWR